MSIAARALRLAALLTGLVSIAIAQIEIASVRITGNQRFTSRAIADASGLQAGATVSRDELGAAMQRLLDTGLFRSVNYRSDPKPGGKFEIALIVVEDAANTPAMLDIPGVASDKIWLDAKNANLLLDRQIPDNDRAIASYTHALETLFEKQGQPMPLISKSEVDLRTGKMSVIFSAKTPLKVAEIRFQGNQVVPSSVLLAAIARFTIGRDYSERDFVQILNLNFKPIYDDRAYLTARILSVSMQPEAGAAIVNGVLDEGPLWTLGSAEVSGEGIVAEELLKVAKFHEGSPAYWNGITASIASMEHVLRTDGYLTASSRPVRKFRPGNEHVVDLNVAITRGKRFFFNSIDIQGLSDTARAQAMKQWTMNAGDPMNPDYVAEFTRQVLVMLKGAAKIQTNEQKVRPGTTDVDIVLKFK